MLAAQTITFGALSDRAYTTTPFTVSATASSGLAPTFSIVSGPATISGNTVTLTGVGTVVVRASQAGNASYAAATPVDRSFAVTQAIQTITFGTLPTKTYGDAPFAVSATASSGLTPTFSIVSGPATILGSTVTLTGAGTVIVSASQAGNTNYLAATSVNQSFTITQATQTITFAAPSAKTYGAAPFAVSATASSGLSPTFTIVPGPATISGSTITLTGTGTVVVRAAQAGNTNYAAASTVDQSFTVMATQTITFGTLSAKTYGNAPFTVSATASSGLSPTFTIVSGPATISGSTVTLTGVGTVVVQAAQAGNTNYAAATSVNQSFTITQATQTITFAAPSAKTYGAAPFAVSATASSGLSPTFSIVSGPATISGNTITLTGAGTVVVRASQAGNANYAAAPTVDQSFIVNTALQNWRQLYFGTTANTGTAADSAISNLDGLPNLVEYALGGKPTVANNAIRPNVNTIKSGGATYLTLTFMPQRSDITYAIETSSNPGGTWTSIPLAGLLTMGQPYTYTDTVAVAAGAPRFIRLRVSGQ